MASPTALAAVAGGAQVGGAVLGAIGSEYKGTAESNMYTYQAGVAQLNKKIALQNSDYALQSGEVEQQESGMRTRGQVGQTHVQQGASNLDVDGGSATDVITSERDIGKQNQDVIRSNAARRAYGFQVEGMQADAQSDIYNMAAKTAKTSGDIGAVSSILGGAGSVASKWYQYGTTFGSGSGGGSAGYGSLYASGGSGSP